MTKQNRMGSIGREGASHVSAITFNTKLSISFHLKLRLLGHTNKPKPVLLFKTH